MLQIFAVLLFVGIPLFVLITYFLGRKLKSSAPVLKEEQFPLADEQMYQTLPAAFLKHLYFNVRHSPAKKRFGSKQTFVYLEEQLRYGTVPLTDWVKHDVPIEDGCEL